MMDADQLRQYVIRPALKALSLWSEAAENLLIGTAAVESRLGTYVHQVGGGPARGIWQCEPATHADLWGSYLKYQSQAMRDSVMRLAPSMQWTSDPIVRVDADALIASNWYAAAVCRLHYRRDDQPLPAANDWPGMAALWKRHYNTPRGAGTVEKFMQALAECRVFKR